MRNPRVLQLIMDSLRYWVMEMHVDGFRFDLASTLARELHEVDKLGAFFDIIHQDPVHVAGQADRRAVGPGRRRLPGRQFSRVVVGMERQVSRLHSPLLERATAASRREFATRFCGSSDLYEWSSRRPHASVNFVTCHDGFTLPDLVSYDHKHNEANGEENRDGANNNISWNCGVEGPTDDPQMLALREQKKRSFLATLLLSQGVPMLLGGDEIGHSQQGNNNAYCQDNELTWLNWNLKPDAAGVAGLYATRDRAVSRAAGVSSPPVLSRQALKGPTRREIAWLDPSGKEMSDEAWHALSSAAWACNSSVNRSTSTRTAKRSAAIRCCCYSMPTTRTRFPSHCRRPAEASPWELVFDTAQYGCEI